MRFSILHLHSVVPSASLPIFLRLFPAAPIALMERRPAPSHTRAGPTPWPDSAPRPQGPCRPGALHHHTSLPERSFNDRTAWTQRLDSHNFGKTNRPPNNGGEPYYTLDPQTRSWKVSTLSLQALSNRTATSSWITAKAAGKHRRSGTRPFSGGLENPTSSRNKWRTPGPRFLSEIAGFAEE